MGNQNDHYYFFITFMIFIASLINLPTCQSQSPQNIETFFPVASPPFPTPPPPPPPPPTPDTSSHISTTAYRKAIFTAVGVSVASTLVLAALVYFLFPRCATASRKNHPITGAAGGSVRLQSLPRSEFIRHEGNIRGLIVDEEGLDVLYWRKLEGIKSKNGTKNYNSGKRVFSRAKSSSSSAYVSTKQNFQDDHKTSLLASASPEPDFQAPPPPPPPPPRGPLPPPPPSRPPPVPRRTPSGDIVQVSTIEDEQLVKLKPLHWEKVNVNPDNSMVWDKIERGSFQCNVDMMEVLFGYVATNRKSPKEGGPSSNNKGAENSNSNSNSKIFIVDSRRSQNAAIVIRSLGITRKELIQGLLHGQGLDAETLEKLDRIAPTKEEKAQILAFEGDVGRLADAESFLYHLLNAVPTAFSRVKAMLFRFTYGSEIQLLKDAIKTFDSACNELRSSRVFAKLLEAILKAGNRLNAGTSRGNAQAFNLTTLLKLSDYKSSDGKTTLLHFVVHEVVRNEGRRCVMIRNNSLARSNSQVGSSSNDSKSKEEQEREFLKLGLPVVGGLSSELQNVKKAAAIDYDAISSSSSSFPSRIAETRELSLKSGADGSTAFVKEMKEFLRGADGETKDVREEEVKVMELVKKTAEYFQAGAFDKNPLQLFVIVYNFVAIVDQACIDIARSLQQRKPKTSARDESSTASSSTPTPDVLRTRVTFPRLPENFLSET